MAEILNWAVIRPRAAEPTPTATAPSLCPARLLPRPLVP